MQSRLRPTGQGRNEDAVSLLTEGLRDEGIFPHDYYNLSQALAQLDRWHQALPPARRAVELAPDDSGFSKWLSEVVAKLSTLERKDAEDTTELAK
jgi:tetratricopeptide (TPR) repeat protein